MGQVSSPSAKGFTVNSIDRQTGPSAGAGQTGNRVLMLGSNAGLNSTASDLIMIGNAAGQSGVNAAGYNGAVLIGSGAASAMSNVPGSASAYNGMTVIGYKAMTLAADMAGCTVIGSAFPILTTSPGAAYFTGNVVIGEQIGIASAGQAGGAGPTFQSVIIGAAAMSQTTAAAAVQSCIIIGFEACKNLSSVGGSPNQCVFIGSDVANNIAGAATNNVVIGDSAGQALSAPSSCVLIGASSNLGTTSDNCTLLGAATKLSANSSASRCTFIGAGAGTLDYASGGFSDILFIATEVSGTRRPILWGDMNAGNLVLGKSTLAQRDLTTLAATNALKLVNGTRGAGNPSTGGFFYVNAGALHWVGSSGTDTTLAVA